MLAQVMLFKCKIVWVWCGHSFFLEIGNRRMLGIIYAMQKMNLADISRFELRKLLKKFCSMEYF